MTASYKEPTLISRELDIVTRNLVEPTVDFLMSQIEEHVHVSNQRKHAIKQDNKEILKESREMLSKLLTGEEERHLIEEGFHLVYLNAHYSPQVHTFIKELEEMSIRDREKVLHSDDENQKVHIFNTVQELFEISHASMCAIYEIGLNFFHDREMHKALAIFSLLTFLNTFIFEGWLMLGCVHQEENNPNQALYAFSMASCVNLEHPLPHLYSAEIYYLNGNVDLAKQTLEYALSMLSKEDLQTYQVVIEKIQNILKK